jgi:hypothetical protein
LVSRIIATRANIIVVDLPRMKLSLLAILLVISGVSGLAQAPKPALPASVPAQASPASKTHVSQLGFSYSVPSDWEVVDAQGTLPEAKAEADKSATSDEEKKGLACVQIAFSARRGEPGSVLVAVARPFDCFGQQMTEKDLPGFAEGASEGLKQSFDVSDPIHGNYTLGSHSMWIERAKGNPKGHPELPYTVEIACGLLKKAAVCWMAMAADDAALRVFENGAITLDGESAQALVPPNAFEKKPS